jgi:hypothetical protein
VGSAGAAGPAAATAAEGAGAVFFFFLPLDGAGASAAACRHKTEEFQLLEAQHTQHTTRMQPAPLLPDLLLQLLFLFPASLGVLLPLVLPRVVLALYLCSRAAWPLLRWLHGGVVELMQPVVHQPQWDPHQALHQASPDLSSASWPLE